ncbi:MAG: hypothetical protein ABWY56_01675 [Propionibacteriaceae bacterium]
MVRMIPVHWTPHRRARDEELVGYLVPRGDAVVPVTLFGYPLGEPGEAGAAKALLEAVGLSVLADPWELELADGERVRVRIREVSADRLVVFTDDFGFGGNLQDAFVLEVPEPGRLTRV